MRNGGFAFKPCELFLTRLFFEIVSLQAMPSNSAGDSQSTNSNMALVLFSNANPYTDAFSLPIRPLVIGNNIY